MFSNNQSHKHSAKIDHSIRHCYHKFLEKYIIFKLIYNSFFIYKKVVSGCNGYVYIYCSTISSLIIRTANIKYCNILNEIFFACISFLKVFPPLLLWHLYVPYEYSICLPNKWVYLFWLEIMSIVISLLYIVQIRFGVNC